MYLELNLEPLLEQLCICWSHCSPSPWTDSCCKSTESQTGRTLFMSPNGSIDTTLPIDMILLDSERAVVVQELCMMAVWG